MGKEEMGGFDKFTRFRLNVGNCCHVQFVAHFSYVFAVIVSGFMDMCLPVPALLFLPILPLRAEDWRS